MMNLINEILKDNGVNLQVSREVLESAYELSDDFSESFEIGLDTYDIQLLVENTEEEEIAKKVYVLKNGEFYKIFA